MAESSAGHKQVCTSFQTDNHTSTPPLSFLQAECPSCRPTNSVKALKTSRSVDISCPHQQTHTRKPAVAACSGRLGQTDRETDTRQLHRTCSASLYKSSLSNLQETSKIHFYEIPEDFYVTNYTITPQITMILFS